MIEEQPDSPAVFAAGYLRLNFYHSSGISRMFR